MASLSNTSLKNEDSDRSLTLMVLENLPNNGDIIPIQTDLLPSVATVDSEGSSSDTITPLKSRPSSKARAKKARKTLQQSLSSQPRRPPLRPAKDILSRIRHDPALDNNDFIVGYHDRHADVMEMPVAMWKGGGDVTDEEFIPQHRILYFRRKTDGVKVWDRKQRTDLLFGSGNGCKIGDGNRESDQLETDCKNEDGEGVINDEGKGDPLNYAGEPSGKFGAEYQDEVMRLLM